jgi:hypothetical protein
MSTTAVNRLDPGLTTQLARTLARASAASQAARIATPARATGTSGHQLADLLPVLLDPVPISRSSYGQHDRTG